MARVTGVLGVELVRVMPGAELVVRNAAVEKATPLSREPPEAMLRVLESVMGTMGVARIVWTTDILGLRDTGSAQGESSGGEYCYDNSSHLDFSLGVAVGREQWMAGSSSIRAGHPVGSGSSRRDESLHTRDSAAQVRHLSLS